TKRVGLDATRLPAGERSGSSGGRCGAALGKRAVRLVDPAAQRLGVVLMRVRFQALPPVLARLLELAATLEQVPEVAMRVRHDSTVLERQAEMPFGPGDVPARLECQSEVVVRTAVGRVDPDRHLV